jgi:hypothetical protein
MITILEAFDRVRKLVAFVRNRKEEKGDQKFLDDMRRQKLETGASGYRVVISSDDARRCSRLEKKGDLVRHSVDTFHLPVHGLSSRFRSRSGAQS